MVEREQALFRGGTVTLFPGEGEGLVYFLEHGQLAEEVWAALQRPRPSLAAISGLDWNRQLSPWPQQGVFAGEDFAGGGPEFLAQLTTELLPTVEAGRPPAWRGLVGYSLAGLFALWAGWQSDCFQRLASVSGSLWYEGFLAYLSSHLAEQRPELVYLSLGDREKYSKEPRLAQVEACTLEVLSLLGQAAIPCLWQQNPGGHFQAPARRLAQGIEGICQLPTSFPSDRL